MECEEPPVQERDGQLSTTTLLLKDEVGFGAGQTPLISNTSGDRLELLDPDIVYPLPEKYLRLLRVFKAVDNALHFERQRGKTLEFTELKDSVEASTKLSFSESHLSQILEMFPEAYVVMWETKRDKHHLIVKFPKPPPCENMLQLKQFFERRKNILRLHLVKFAKRQFPIALTSAPSLTWEEYIRAKAPDVPGKPLPPPPESKSLNNTQQFIETMQNRSRAAYEQRWSEERVSDVGLVSGVSPKLALLIRKKEANSRKLREACVPVENMEKLRLIEKLKQLTEALLVVYNTQKTPSLFYNQLIHKLKETTNISQDLVQLDKWLRELISISGPDALLSVRTNCGEVIRYDRQKFSREAIFSLINSRYL